MSFTATSLTTITAIRTRTAMCTRTPRARARAYPRTHHADGSSHTHDHTHAHEHDHEHEAAHAHSHDGLLKNKAEAAAFLQYTLNHNAHHEEELDSLVHTASSIWGSLGKPTRSPPASARLPA
jgi:ABC-type Zn2+ transport system substrate-binding protein/surface adhesin